jgi:hypothetical protein
MQYYTFSGYLYQILNLDYSFIFQEGADKREDLPSQYHAGDGIGTGIREIMRMDKTMDADFSIVNNCSVSLQNFFRLPIKFVSHLMDLVFLATACTSQPHSSAHAMYFKLFGTFFTFHDFLNRAFVHG